jgi:hypothetical protein
MKNATNMQKTTGSVSTIVMLVSLGVWLGMATDAQASLDLTTANAAYYDPNSPNLSASAIAGDLGITTTALGSVLFDTDGSKGPLIGSYSFSPQISQALPITISYVAGTKPADATYMYVKDGNDGGYIFNLGSTGAGALDWNGTESIYIDDLFSPKGAGDLSHIELFGSVGTVSVVPEPTTIISGGLLILPFGANALRVLRKARAIA